MSGSVTGAVARPGSKPGPPSRFHRESLFCVGPPHSSSCGGVSSGVPGVVVPGANSWKFHL